MPAWPVTVSAKHFDGIPPPSTVTRKEKGNGISDREKVVFEAILKGVNVYFNNDSSTPKCTDFNDIDATGDLDGFGWNVLACNQLAMPTTNGPNSMFINNTPFNYTFYTCNYSFVYSLEDC